MRAPDFSNNKCYPLEMVNTEDADLRMRLECRTGASVSISNSRIFVFGGCTLPIEIEAGFELNSLYDKIVSSIKEVNSSESIDHNLIDYNDYISGEGFRLSLINRKWYHYKRTETTICPVGRMFHSMVVDDNYIYVMGGLRFDSNNKFEILNDVWRFDTIDKHWKCYYPNGNDVIVPRADHGSFVIDSADLFDKSLFHPGLGFVGGLNLKGERVPKLQLLDVLDENLKVLNFEDLTEFQYLNDEIICNHQVLNLRGSTNSIHAGSCPVSNDTRLAIFDKTPDLENFEPFIVFNESRDGVRLPHQNDFDLEGLNSLDFPIFGTFGENAIVSGYSKTEKKMLSFVYNIKNSSWTKLHISCMHKIYSHRLTKGFVWESHHKVAFLGSMKMTNTCGSVDYFDNLVILTLPFTNFFGKQPVINKSKMNNAGSSSSSIMSTKMSTASDSQSINSNDIRKRSDSVTSGISVTSQPKSTLLKSQIPLSNLNGSGTLPTPISNLHTSAPQQHPNDHSGGFAGYAFHVAQQIQVNSIRSVLPPYAIAIGKSAFERNNSFSDFDLVCSDGTVISVPLTLCRRRWGAGFDELFVDAYAKSYVEGKAHDLLSSRTSTYDSVDSTENMSVNSRNALNTPYFRYPFQEKDSVSGSVSSSINQNLPFSNLHSNKLDASPNRGLNKSAAANSRHHSISGNLFASTSLNRASISLSLSRRNSATVHSRHQSFTQGNGSRRGSLNSPSRRNSLNIPINQNSRRGSALSRSSFLSSSSSTSSTNSFIKSVPSLTSSMNRNSTNISPQGSSNMLPLSPSITGSKHTNSDVPSFSSINFDKKSNKSKEGLKKEYVAPNEIEKGWDDVDELEEEFCKFNLCDIPPPLPMPNFLPNGESMKITTQGGSSRSHSEELHNLGITLESLNKNTDEELAELIYNEDSGMDLNASRFNSLRLPRSMYLPYQSETVNAIVEYLYSGQIGANWKLFPTGIQLLVATKQLNIPLLYDLVLELFFVVLGIIESSCKSKLILYLERNRDGESCDDIYQLLGGKGNDDLNVELELLLEAIGNIRRDSGATISSELMIDEHDDELNKILKTEYEQKRKESQINGVDPLDIGPMENVKVGINEDNETNIEDGNMSTSKIDLNARGVNDVRKLSNVDRIKVTAAALDSKGFEIFDDYDDELGGGNTFKNYSMDNVEGKGNMNGKNGKGGKGKNKKKKKKKLREWPLLKELLNDELQEDTTEVVIELFIETGALINDSKLMLHSLHVQELQKKVKLLRNDSHHNNTGDGDDKGEVDGASVSDLVGSLDLGGKIRSNNKTMDDDETSSSSSSSSSNSSSGPFTQRKNISADNVNILDTKKVGATVVHSNSKAHPRGISSNLSSSNTLSPATSNTHSGNIHSTGPAIGNFDTVDGTTAIIGRSGVLDNSRGGSVSSNAVSSTLHTTNNSPRLGPVLSPSSSMVSFSSTTTTSTTATTATKDQGKNKNAGKKDKDKKSKKGFFTRFRK